MVVVRLLSVIDSFCRWPGTERYIWVKLRSQLLSLLLRPQLGMEVEIDPKVKGGAENVPETHLLQETIVEACHLSL